jgi:hypothetical protein
MVRTVGVVATWLGYAARLVLFVLDNAPFVAASLLVIYGVSLMSDAVAYIVSGILLYILFAAPKRGKR